VNIRQVASGIFDLRLRGVEFHRAKHRYWRLNAVESLYGYC
jgi:biotin operon repressor